MIFQLSDWFSKPIIWAIIVKFDQIRKNWWRISCAEILEVGKIFFAASSVKKMSRFEEVSPEEIKRIVDNATSINTKRPESGVLVQHNQFQHLQSSANSTAFIARGGQIFPRPQYNFSNCNVQIHNHCGQSGWTIDSWHCDTFCPLKVIRFFEETDINIFFERTFLSARCQFIQVFARQLDRAFMTGHVMFCCMFYEAEINVFNGNFRLLDCLKIY